MVDQVAEDGFPHQLCGYLYDLATAFMRFYESCPILNAEPVVIERAVPYFRLTLGSTLLLAVTLTIESAFRSARNTTTPLLIAGVGRS